MRCMMVAGSCCCHRGQAESEAAAHDGVQRLWKGSSSIPMLTGSFRVEKVHHGGGGCELTVVLFCMAAGMRLRRLSYR